MRVCLVLALCLALTGCAWNRGGDINFKFITSGQSVDDGLVISRVIQGLTLKPATPSDAKIFRDAQNNALIQWRRRGRINYHWRDRAGVPLSEEAEWYEVETYNGSTLVHTYRVPVAQSQPIQWQPGNADTAYVTIATDGSGTAFRTVNGADPVNPTPVLGSKQIIDGNFVFEFEIYQDGTGVYLAPAPMIDSAYDAASGNTLGSWGASNTFSAQIWAAGTSGVSPNVSAVAGDRFAISYIDGVMKWYKNPISDNSPVFFQDIATQGYAPYWIRTVFPYGASWGIRNPTLLRFTIPDWTYTAAMQTGDGLTPGNPIHLKIYMVSAVAGRGIPLDFTG